VPKPSRRAKIIIGSSLILLFLIIGFVDPWHVFRVPFAHVQLPAEEVFSLFGFPITNTMLAAWFTIIVVVGLSYIATRKMKIVPSGLQNIVEAGVEMLYNFVRGVAGERYGRSFFPIIATIFIFVMFNAWLALLPFFGAGIYIKETGTPLLRGANTDINFPLTLAIVSFIFVEYWGIRALGLFRYLRKFFNIGGLLRGHILTGITDMFVGLMELISEFARLISFTFRLFGNMLAGELLLIAIVFLIPLVMVVPFYGLELFIGFVQALIFGGLTLVFATMAVTPREHG